MHFISTSLLCAVLALGASASQKFPTPRFIVSFGDSFTSEAWNGTGNPLEPYPLQCSTGGPMWPRQLATLIGNATLFNIAVGGSTTNDSIIPPISPSLDFKGQAAAFLKFQSQASWSGNDTVFEIAVGTNDVLNSSLDASDKTSLYNQVLDSYFQIVGQLYAAGGRRFVLSNVIPLAKTPFGAGGFGKLAQNAIQYNAVLEKKAAEFQKSKPDTSTVVFDTHKLFANMMNKPSSYGFNTGDKFCMTYMLRMGCEIDPTVDPVCNGPIDAFMWKDMLHPSWTSHKQWALELYNLLK